MLLNKVRQSPYFIHHKDLNSLVLWSERNKLTKRKIMTISRSRNSLIYSYKIANEVIDRITSSILILRVNLIYRVSSKHSV